MITLRWSPFPGADVASYRVYRYMIGFTGTLAALVDIDGETLELAFNGGATQIVTFDAVTPIVDAINAVVVGNGGEAFASENDPAKFIVRSTIQSGPSGSVEIVGGTALPDLGLTAKLVTEQSDEELIASILALPDPNDVVSFDDLDGSVEDYYKISTVDSLGAESQKTEFKQAVSFTGAICVIEGIVTDLQGARKPDAEVCAKIISRPQSVETASLICKDEVCTVTDASGRFSLAVLQGAVIEFTIPAAGVSQTIEVPESAFVFLTDLDQTIKYRYPIKLQ
jgi:hypothetical protein